MNAITDAASHRGASGNIEDMDSEQQHIIATGDGFFAALDPSGGSTPRALADYGVGEDRYHSEAEMFDLVHAMRTKVMTSPAFDGKRVLAAILFAQTMDRAVDGVPTASYLWQVRRIVPFLKVDVGLAAAERGVRLMRPIDTLESVLERAQAHAIFGTKMRSLVTDADRDGVNAVADQQFDYAARIAEFDLVPILEPEVSIHSADKAGAEAMLHEALQARLCMLAADVRVLLKLTIPTQPGLYADLVADPRVLRVLALSGGYSREKACALLAKDQVMIASFSRALLAGLNAQQSDEEFTAALEHSIAEIYAASVTRTAPV